MRRNLKILFFSIVFGIVLFANVGYSAIFSNDIVEGFPEPESGNIESSVTEGSSLFFQGMADLMNQLDEGEKGAANALFPNSANLIDSAIGKFKMAKEKYVQAANIGENVEKTRCNFTYLKAFNYGQFAEENGLISEIVTDVRKYLSNGDVVGFYRDDYWRLLRQASRLMLFGNYGTMVGKTAYYLL